MTGSVDISPLLLGLRGMGVPWLAGGRTLAGMDCWGPVDWVQRQLGRVPPAAPWDGAGGPGFLAPMRPKTARSLLTSIGHDGSWVWSEMESAADLRVGDVALSFLDAGPHVACVYQEKPCRVVTIFNDGGLVQTHHLGAVRFDEVWRLVRGMSSSPSKGPAWSQS